MMSVARDHDGDKREECVGLYKKGMLGVQVIIQIR
jgi:hypothetical protein